MQNRLLDTEEVSITVTELAKSHFQKLLDKENEPGMNLRIFVSKPLTAMAEIGVTFCPENEEEKTDISINLGRFNLFVDKSSIPALKEAILDYEEETNESGLATGGQIAIKAPHLKGKKPKNESPLAERLQYVLDSEINPNLADHGGRVSLVEILEGSIVVLQFGGGCHGCGMANVTLKQGIEKTLKEKFPEITEVRDSTDHSTGKNPYY